MQRIQILNILFLWGNLAKRAPSRSSRRQAAIQARRPPCSHLPAPWAARKAEAEARKAAASISRSWSKRWRRRDETAGVSGTSEAQRRVELQLPSTDPPPWRIESLASHGAAGSADLPAATRACQGRGEIGAPERCGGNNHGGRSVRRPIHR